MKLYHITRPKNIESILTIGILPKMGKGLTREGFNEVFLTNNIDKIIKTQGGTDWENNIAILEVDIENHKPHIYKCYGQPKYSDFEFTVPMVPSDKITGITLIKNEHTEKFTNSSQLKYGK